MTKQERKINSKKKLEQQKIKEREKRIKQRNKVEQEQFDIDTETVIGMTNRNNQKIKQKKQVQLAKKQAKQIKRKNKIKNCLKIILFLAIIIAAICFALVSPIFNIQKINVSGNEQVNADTIISLSELQKNQNIFKFSTEKTKEKIKSNPYIENVTIKRRIPDKIEIVVEERKEQFNVEFLNGYAYIDNQGYILKISEQKADFPTIKGISTGQEQIAEGNRLNEEDLSKLETVIQIMNISKEYEIYTKITSVDIIDVNNFILKMEDEKKTIYLGNSSNLNSKILYIPSILDNNKGKEGTIYLNGDINNGFNPRFREGV